MLLSDGDDTSSLIEFDEVLDLAKRSETAIYAIGLRQGEIGRPRLQGSGVRAAAAVAGNRRPGLLPDHARELPKIYQQICDELSSQYTHRLHLEEPEAQRRVAPHRRPHRASPD